MLVAVNGTGSWELVPFPADRKAIDIGDYYGNWTLANKLLGWRPVIGLQDGLMRSLGYYRINRSLYWE
jgi:nucleoside-diphosphate-sugar epimerase